MTTTVQVASANGCKVPVLAWRVSQTVGIPFAAVCAFLEQESAGGMNVFGHDGGDDGWYSGAGTVTKAKYLAYKAGRAAHMAQGVGPIQLTWPPYQDQADAAGGCWLPMVNMRVGFSILKGFTDAGKTWHEAAALYNGSEDYADQVDAKITRWQQLLAGATPPGDDVPDNRYQRINFRGHSFDRMTAQALMEVEAMLGYELTITQGSYNSSVPQSGGTHDGGGAADLVPWHWADKVLALRKVGFAAWHRPYLPGVWGEHIHCELLGNERASSGAKAQWADYRAGRNGLADHGPDNGPRLNPIPMFHYTPGGKVPPPEDPPQKPPAKPAKPPGHYAQELAIQHGIGDAIHAIERFQANFPTQGGAWTEIETELKALWLKAHAQVN